MALSRSGLLAFAGVVVVGLFLAQVVRDGGLSAQEQAAEEFVAFNRKSLKYHCLECTWAKKCTVNCVKITRSEAIRRGGVPCKVCGGSCRAAQEAA
jgi:hypothetical protein